MDTTYLDPLVEDLTTNIDDLEEALAPLLSSPLSHQTSKLPLLDQAKLCVLATYSIESLLFSSLRLNSVDAKSHPVFKELGRVKEYFNKIKAAESAGAGAKRNVSLDKEAAGRFIKAGLAGNETFDRERKERVERERAGAKRKLEEMSVGTHTRFEGASKRVKALESEDASDEVVEEEGNAVGDGDGRAKASSGDDSKKKRRKGSKDYQNGYESEVGSERSTAAVKGPPGKQRAKSKKSKKPKDSKEALESLLEGALDDSNNDKKKKKRKKDREKSEDEKQ